MQRSSGATRALRAAPSLCPAVYFELSSEDVLIAEFGTGTSSARSEIVRIIRATFIYDTTILVGYVIGIAGSWLLSMDHRPPGSREWHAGFIADAGIVEVGATAEHDSD